MRNKELLKIIENIKKLVNNPKQEEPKKEQKEIEIKEEQKQIFHKEEKKQENYCKSPIYIPNSDDSDVQKFRIGNKIVYGKRSKLNL